LLPGCKPSANKQKAMTPVLMNLKAAAQQAYDAVSRASEDVCGRGVYKNSTRQIRKNLRISGVTQGAAAPPHPSRDPTKRFRPIVSLSCEKPSKFRLKRRLQIDVI
jgi:hypothetical protein